MLYKAIEGIYKKMLFSRKDPDGTIRYFSHEDFPHLKAEPFDFTAGQGHKLQGYFYSYEDLMPDRLVVLDHGLGNGHRAYMREIEKIAAQGCTVFSYDHTGCNKSGGRSTNGFAQSLNDLDRCISAIKTHPVYGGRKISVIGHSWGGFSTLNITAFHPEIENLVALAGFVSVDRMIGQFFKGPLKPYRKRIKAIEKEANPDFADISAEDTLANTNSRILLIQSDDDGQVLAKDHFYILKKKFEGKENIRFISLKGKGHNPNYTSDAVKYLAEFSADLQKKLKKKKLVTPEQKSEFLNSYDWYRMTEQDEEIWKEIFNTLFA